MTLKQALMPLLVAAALSACAVGPDYQRPGLALPQGSEQAQVDAHWWRQFGDATLNRLIADAQQYNRDLQQTAARVDEAAAAAGAARASQLPQVNASLSGARAQTSRYSSGAGALGESYTGGLSASWELDLWGKEARKREAANADLTQSQRLLDGARRGCRAAPHQRAGGRAHLGEQTVGQFHMQSFLAGVGFRRSSVPRCRRP